MSMDELLMDQKMWTKRSERPGNHNPQLRPDDGGSKHPLKRRSTSARLHGAMSQKSVIFKIKLMLGLTTMAI
jgi:hypothetical protein